MITSKIIYSFTEFNPFQRKLHLAKSTIINNSFDVFRGEFFTLSARIYVVYQDLVFPSILPFIISCKNAYLWFLRVFCRYAVFRILIDIKSSLPLPTLCNIISLVLWSVYGIFKSLLKTHISKAFTFLSKLILTVQASTPWRRIEWN